MRAWLAAICAAVLFFAPLTSCMNAEEYISGKKWEEPKIIDPGPPGGPPADAIVLFDGKDLSAWEGGDKWKIDGGAASARGGGISTKQPFGDCQLHVEWAAP